MARQFDSAVLFGTGSTAFQPLGLYASTAISSISAASTTAGGAAISYTLLARAKRWLMDANVEAGRRAFICSPRTAMELGAALDDQAQPLRRPESMADVSILPSAAVADTYTYGGTTDAGVGFFGAFGHLLLGNRLGARGELLKERYANTYAFGFLGHTRFDSAPEYDQAFRKVVGLSPSTSIVV
jgi:HK97 family phage major capsid protein